MCACVCFLLFLLLSTSKRKMRQKQTGKNMHITYRTLFNSFLSGLSFVFMVSTFILNFIFSAFLLSWFFFRYCIRINRTVASVSASHFSSVRKWSGLKSLLFLYLNMYVQGIRSVPHCKQFYNKPISAICHYAINGLTIRKYFHLRLYSSLAITAVDAFVISILKWCGS